MPKITFIEEDITGTPAVESVSVAAFIPMVAEEAYQGKIEFCETEKKLAAVIGSTYKSKNHKAAKALIELGIPLYIGGLKEDITSSTTGSEKDSVIAALIKSIKDKNAYDVRFLTLGCVESTNAALAKLLIDAAAERGDCVAIVDTKKDDNTAEKTITTINAVVNAMTNAENLKFASAFAPWCHIEALKVTSDSTTDDLYPASIVYIATFANSIKSNPAYLAAAGVNRGVCPFTAIPVADFGSESDLATLATREGGKVAVNPICNVRNYGIVVYGNRTMFKNSSTVEGGLVASSFLNIRQVAIDIKKFVAYAARRFTFDPNDALLWNSFIAIVNPKLEEIKANRGITGSRILRVATNEKATIKALIRVIPIEAVEDFYLTLSLSDSIAEVTEQ